MTTEERSRLMKSVAQSATAQELIVRKTLHGCGYRYVVNDMRLPGRPDLVFPRRKCAIFVHGCFWHGHECKHGRHVPKTNTGFWVNKILANRERDARKRRELEVLGWRVLEVWECEITSNQWLNKTERFLRRSLLQSSS